MMVVAMAIFTLVVFQWCHQTCFMALFTIYLVMLPKQFKVSLVVVESFHSFVEVKGFLGMALFAVLSEFIIVDILVAGSTVGKGKPCEFLCYFAVDNFRLVALNTGNILMLP